jgi:hypothetical protein
VYAVQDEERTVTVVKVRRTQKGYLSLKRACSWTKTHKDQTIASDLLQQDIQTLVDDNAQWQTLIADDILWKLAYAPALGHPARVSLPQKQKGATGLTVTP